MCAAFSARLLLCPHVNTIFSLKIDKWESPVIRSPKVTVSSTKAHWYLSLRHQSKCWLKKLVTLSLSSIPFDLISCVTVAEDSQWHFVRELANISMRLFSSIWVLSSGDGLFLHVLKKRQSHNKGNNHECERPSSPIIPLPKLNTGDNVATYSDLFCNLKPVFSIHTKSS